MSETFSNLIDFTSLIKVIQKHQNLLNRHESLHEDQSLFKAQNTSKLQAIEKTISDLQSQSKSFTSGLLSISKIEEKLASWSERFRSFEEGQFELKSKIKSLEDHYEKKFEEQRINHVKQLSMVENSFLRTIEERFSKLSFEIKSGCNQNSEEIEVIKERMFEWENDTKAKNQPVEAKKYQRSFSSLNLISRIEDLELALSNLEEFKGGNAFEDKKGESLGRSPRDILGVREMWDKIQSELHETVKKEVVSQINQLNLEEKSQNHLVPETKESSFSGRKGLRNATHKIDSDLLGLERKILSLDEKLSEMQKRHSMISFPETSLKPLQIPKPALISKVSLEVQDESSEEEQSPNRSSSLTFPFQLHQISEDLEKIKKSLPLMMYKSELEEILSQFSKKIRDTRKPFPEPEDFNPKIQEQDQRLNIFWKNLGTLNEKHALIESKLQKLSDNFDGLSELLKLESHSHIKSAEESLNLKLADMKSSVERCLKSAHEVPAMHNEQYFRSMILSLRNEIQALKDESESRKSKHCSPIPLDAQIELEEIQEPLQLGMVHSILKQHETAIRLLANKTFPRPEDQKTASDSVDYLSHLEDLKKEMKEILSKQDEKQNLSNKDLEIIENILNSLESKIGKEELSQMAEKNELHKIYRMLKRRIDELALAVQRKNEAANKDEACFLKRKVNCECASCGQLVPERVEGRLVYESWNKFPVKTPNNATGFSRILNSLVLSPSGGLVLPREGRSASTLEMISPTQVTVKSKTRKVSTRTAAVKPKLI